MGGSVSAVCVVRQAAGRCLLEAATMSGQLFIMPWFHRDFLAATLGWSLAETGAYFLLLGAQWETGPLPGDHTSLASICRTDVREFKKLWPKISRKFVVTDAGLVNMRLETEGGGDCTEIATHAYINGVLHLGFDGWYGQTSADRWIEQLIDQVASHRPFAFFGEQGPIRRAIEPFLLRRMRERLKTVPLVWLSRPHDKPTMARALQGMAALGKVKIADTAYGNRLLAQLVQFPMAQTDDGVDMAALMALAIDQAHPAIVTAPAPKAPPRGARTIDEMIHRYENRQGEYGKI